MLIKSADDRARDVETLRSLAAHPSATPDQRSRIEKETRFLLAGIKGEKEAAYQIDFHLAGSNNWAVLHDLRLEHAGRVAQIDHIVINRFFDMWVCESKSFAEGIAINEHGECSAFLGGKPYGLPSPFEQNHRHCSVLKVLFDDGYVPLPTRLGLSIQPAIRSLILVSKSARISRPKAKVKEVDQILKVDQAVARMKADMDGNTILAMGKVIGVETLHDFARSLAARHRPVSVDWHATFGLPPFAASPTPEVASAPAAPPQPVPQSPADEVLSKVTCAACGTLVPLKVARFCWFNKARFGGQVYCRDCQPKLA